MSETRLVSVRLYNDTAVGHVSVGLGSGIYEQQWSQESYAGLFFSQAGPNDGTIGLEPNFDRMPALTVSISVSREQM